MRSYTVIKIVARYSLSLLVLLYATIFISLTVLLASKASLIADDFRYLQPGFPILQFMYNGDSGRLSHGVIIAICEKFFGEMSVNFFPVIVVLLFIVSVCTLFFTIFRNRWSILGGSIIAILFMTISHSFFDFSLFFSAATTHTMTLIYLVFLSALLVYANYIKFKFKTFQYFIILPACFIGGLFSELASMISCLIIILAAALSVTEHYTEKQPTLTEIIKSIHPLYVGTLLMNVFSFLVIYFSPGSINRRANSDSGSSILSILNGALSDYLSMILHFISSPVNLATIVCGSIILRMLMANNPKIRPHPLIAVFLFGLPFFIFVTTNYSLGYTAMRIYNLADLSFFFAVTIILSYNIEYLKNYKLFLNRKWLLGICVSLAILALYSFTIDEFTDIYKAQAARSELLKYRKEQISSALRSDDSTVVFTPAPLLLTKTEAIDMTYYPNESPGSTWLYEDLLNYYHLTSADKHVVVSRQPSNYCIEKDVLSRFHEVLAKKCRSY